MNKLSLCKWTLKNVLRYNLGDRNSFKDMQGDSTSISFFRLKYAKFVSAAAILLYPVSGYILKFLDPSAIEYMSHRLAISAYFLLLFLGLTYLEGVKKQALPLLMLGLTIGVIWCIWIVHVNDFDQNYSLVLIAAIGATAISIMYRTHLVIYLLFSTLALAFTIFWGNYSHVHPLGAVMANTILGAILLISNEYKERMRNEIVELNTQLTASNQILEEKVSDRTRLLKSKNDELENFVYIVSHDLKSPLRNIGSFSQLIRTKIQKDDLESVAEYSGVIENNISQMAELLDDLLEYGSVGKTTSSFSEIDPRSTLSAVIQNNFKNEDHKAVEFTLKENFPEHLIADQKQISLLFQNLIENALKYNHSKLKKVEIGYDSVNGFHKIYVQDNGIGIRAEDEEQVFKMFKRLHSGEDFEGTGIGLAICQRIAENHQGSIQFKSKENEGTTFSIELPTNLALSNP